MNTDKPCYVVALFGGACAGSVAAEMLAARGVLVAVFEQNPRPYGKIEDGLPRWHKQQRLMEYRKIDARLDRPGVLFVPNTKLGDHVDFHDILTWGWSAVLLATGAWKDRPLDVPRADEFIGRGLVYQNPFVYWFNHLNEAGYTGPRYEVPDGAVCIGGGLASIDVIKIFQLEIYGRALERRGIDVSMYDLEHKGIPKLCQEHGIDDPAALGVTDSLLVYRRRVEDMPLASPPAKATEAQIQKIGAVRQKILAKAQEKYLFRMRPLALPKELIIEGDRVVGLRLLETVADSRQVKAVPGSEFEVRSDLIVSSIGSIPEPLPGIEMEGIYYKFADWDTGAYAPAPGVFALGNVVTGKGNIVASVNHGKFVAAHVIEKYLGLGAPVADETRALPDHGTAVGEAAANRVQAHLSGVAPLPPEQVQALVRRVAARQQEVGYGGSYRDWLQQVTPPDLE